ncbi:MAG: hypothetical protein JST12_09030 [Armatimonadetes bacterium]|nr:hypothetical protein [Armatimonadota bacterium]MBS1728690.1 hypothetical protein [Armatimonadota bacterium]
MSSVLVASYADAGMSQKKKSSGSYSGPETGLLGVKLYDSGLRVISLYGNPDSITTVSVSTSTSNPGAGGPPGGFGGPGGAPGGSRGGPSAAGNSGGSGGTSRSADSFIPGGLVPGTFGDTLPDMQKGPQGGPGMSGPTAAPGQGGRGPTGAPTGGPTGAPGAGGSGPGGTGTGATEAAVFTRWSYTRNGCKLAFVIDKFDRVIQIEAIGLQNQRIKTRRGVGFGSTFSQVMKAYAPSMEPDGYDISGNNFTVRFLTRQRVAFRLTQLSSKKAHVVTGIVVAAGKQ